MSSARPPIPSPVVAGEDRVLLAHALAPLVATMRRTKDGRFKIEGPLSGAEGEALARALMRIEAELLVDDADALGPGGLADVRSQQARRMDALGELVCRLLPPDFVQPESGETTMTGNPSASG